MGWWIVIEARTPEECEAAITDRAVALVAWEEGSGGIRCLEQLTAEGKAVRLSDEGYPNRYPARAGDMLPLFD